MQIPYAKIVVSKKDFELKEIQIEVHEFQEGTDISEMQYLFDFIYEMLFNCVNVGIIVEREGNQSSRDKVRVATYAYLKEIHRVASLVKDHLSKDSKRIRKWLDLSGGIAQRIRDGKGVDYKYR